MEVCEWGEAMHYMASMPKDTPEAYTPHTLTGDEWRTAWAEAHDAATDRALDAVY